MSYILVLDDFMINDKICIHLNYDVDFYDTPNDIISNNIIESLNKIKEEYNVKEDGFIFLLDISKLKSSEMDAPKIKFLISKVMDKFPNMLHKCIVYNYTKTVKMLFKLIKNFLDKITANKIVIDESISLVVSSIVNDPSIIDNITTNNN